MNSATSSTGVSRFSSEAQAAVPEGENIALGINIYKAGSDPPLLADSECPAWLWTLAEPPLTLGQLQRKADQDLDIPLVSHTHKFTNAQWLLCSEDFIVILHV